MGKIVISDNALAGYRFKYKIASKEEITDLIKNNSKEYCLLVPAITFRKHLFVYDLETKNIVYAYIETSGLIFKEKELAEMSNVIEGKGKK